MDVAQEHSSGYNNKQFAAKLLSMLKPYRKRYTLGLIAAGLAAAFDTLSPLFLREGVNSLQENRPVGWLWALAGAIIFTAAIGGVFRYFMREGVIVGSRLFEYDSRARLFGHILGLSPTFFDDNHTGDLMARATEDIERQRMVVGPAILHGVNTFLIVIFSGIMMFVIDHVLTLGVLGLAPIVMITVFFVARKLHHANLRQQAAYSDLSSFVQENLSGIRVVKAFAREDHESERFADVSQRYLKHSLELARIEAVFFPSFSMLIGLGIAGMLWIGTIRIGAGQMSLGDFVAFMTYLNLMTWPMMALGWMTHMYQRGFASGKRIHTIESAPLQFTDDNDGGFRPDSPEVFEAALESKNIPSVDILPPEIIFNHVSLQYGGNGNPALSDFSATIPAKTTVAIVGSVGSGKSSVVRLLPRLYPVTSGEILLDGKPLHSYTVPELRRMIGYVDQTPFLFSADLRENISLGRENATQDEIEAAAKAACFDRTIVDFSDGWDTMLGERGVTLSGGQQQRLTLARALLMDPPLLILDDALSAVDTDTEAEILKNLNNRQKGRTTLFVTHRLAAAEKAEMILVLDKGKLIEAGSHSELMKLGGAYKAMYSRQRIAEELGAMS